MAQNRLPRLAVLIDAENVSPRVTDRLFELVADIGYPSIRRIYGNFAGQQLQGWSAPIASHAIVPRQNLATSAGKNSADISLVIDAMDLLHGGHVDAFCVVSSDGDFTGLAVRLREQGVDVYGFGEAKAPDGFRAACRRFADLDAAATERVCHSTARIITPPASSLPVRSAVPRIEQALEMMTAVDGWYSLQQLGAQLKRLSPDFDQHSYGCGKLVTLVERAEAYDIERRDLCVFFRRKEAADLQRAAA